MKNHWLKLKVGDIITLENHTNKFFTVNEVNDYGGFRLLGFNKTCQICYSLRYLFTPLNYEKSDSLQIGDIVRQYHHSAQKFIVRSLEKDVVGCSFFNDKPFNLKFYLRTDLVKEEQ